MRKWIIPLAVLMVVPALGAAAPIVQPPEAETLVEGHTVFTVIEQINRNANAVEEYGAAVAVLVREATQNSASYRFPGVLWFNDQYLVNPYSTANPDIDYRYPCTGAVLATNSGAGDPLAAFAALTPTYVESYTITDPNDRTWTVDRWTDAGVGPIWVVAIMNNQAGISTADDGVSSCAPVDETEDPSLGLCPTGTGNLGIDPLRCSDGSYITTNGNAVSYNALLYFVLSDLTVAGAVKDHNKASADYANDRSGCHETDPIFNTYSDGRGTWDCPNADDNAEGNSHPYNPFSAGTVCPNCAGATEGHGGSGGGANLHATRNVDIFYGTAPAPVARTTVITDLEGSTAPFHCEDNPAVPGGCMDTPFPAAAGFGQDTYRG
ncbi:MAG TPA: hypothetical protein VNX21_08070 [Candidatus Thermoplasmatota archaeon]|nr:hypothetical protein [Candidatus Thermoplasmatota archaeon]